MARRVSSPVLIGRADELASLAAAFERAAGGEFRAVVVGGEAGVGKTRLVGELGRQALERGGRVLGGDCVELAEGELAFAPVTAALREAVRELGAAEVERLPGREELGRLLPELGGHAAPGAGGDSALGEPLAQLRLFEFLLALLARLGERAPLVVALEDLHWADRSTRDLIAFLVRNAHAARLLLVCTYRSVLPRRHPLRAFLAELERRPVVERLELAPLTRAEIGGLVGAILGRAPPERFVGELFARCDGNPFFAEELLAASADGGEIPDTLRDALIARVEFLSEPTQALLRAVAAAGRRVGHRLLERLGPVTESELDEALREAVGAGILVRDDHGYAFRHALVREAVAADTLPGERTRLHLLLAEALSEEPALGEPSAGNAAAELAHHWWQARRLPEALSASLAAAGEAEELFAFAEAHRNLERVLELWDKVADPEARAGCDLAAVLARAAESAHRAVGPDRAAALAGRAIELVDRGADPARAALLHERLGRYRWLDGDVEEAMRSYREAVALMPADPPSPELARVLAAHGQILMLRGHVGESRWLCERAIEVAREVGARAEECHALNTLGVDIAELGDRSRGIECLRSAKEIAEQLGWIDELGRAYTNLSEVVDWDGRTAESAELALEGADEMRPLGARSYAIVLGNEAAQRLLRLGRLGEAGQVLARVGEADPSGFSEAIHHAGEAELACIRGELTAAEHAAHAARQTLGPTRDSMYFAPTAAIEVEVQLAAGRPQDALATFEQTLDLITEEEYAFYVARLYARGVRAYADCAQPARARKASDQVAQLESAAEAAIARFDALLAPERHPDGDPPPWALVHRAAIDAELSRLRGHSDARLWASAAECWSKLDAPLEQAYAGWRHAEALLLAGAARSQAAEPLSAAADTARRTGATALLGEIEALARRARVKLHDTDARKDGGGKIERPEQRLGLTDRELEVLTLLAEGMTNRQIGETLFISQRTASVHVSRILAKLEVPSRVAAATKAQQLGLLRTPRP